jgi:hypothetical protein
MISPSQIPWIKKYREFCLSNVHWPEEMVKDMMRVRDSWLFADVSLGFKSLWCHWRSGAFCIVIGFECERDSFELPSRLSFVFTFINFSLKIRLKRKARNIYYRNIYYMRGNQ